MPNPNEDKNTFYNVMPEAAGGPLVHITKPAPAAAPAKPKIKRPFNKTLLLIPLGLIILGAIGFGVWYFIKHSKKPAPVEIQNSIEQTQQQTPDVTTTPDWLKRYFGAETCTETVKCGDASDPDRDGLTNKQEFGANTDPNNPDSDSDGIADGDEANVFGSDPLLSRTYRQGTFNDADFVKGGFDIQTDQPYSADQLAAIKDKIKSVGLHQPTLTTIGDVSFSLYEFTDPNPPQQLPANIDQSVQAKLDRDTQRQTTIKKIGAALLKYQTDKKVFPPASDFVSMTDMIKPYNTVATNYNDPINLNQYVYTYQLDKNGQDFILTYYSETQNQLIKYKAADAQATAAKENTQGNDDQRMSDLENLKSALLVYSSSQIDPNSTAAYVFPPASQLQSALVPHYISALPTDPVTKQKYDYQVGDKFDTFTIKAILQGPPTGTTGYLCNQDECRNY